MTATLPAPLVVADHPALDLLNTQMMVDGQRRDLLTSADVALQWLEALGLDVPGADTSAEQARLLLALKQLRDTLEPLLYARLAGQAADPAALNALLRKAVVQLVWREDGGVSLDRASGDDAVSRCVSQLALSAAELLADGDFSLVRQCESNECTLLFYDRTKSHKRRWCSMAACGNRHKVAEFRKRRQEAGL